MFTHSLVVSADQQRVVPRILVGQVDFIVGHRIKVGEDQNLQALFTRRGLVWVAILILRLVATRCLVQFGVNLEPCSNAPREKKEWVSQVVVVVVVVVERSQAIVLSDGQVGGELGADASLFDDGARGRVRVRIGVNHAPAVAGEHRKR